MIDFVKRLIGSAVVLSVAGVVAFFVWNYGNVSRYDAQPPLRQFYERAAIADRGDFSSASTPAKPATTEDINKPPRDPQRDPRLNIVLFYADDWTMKVMGKLNSRVHTPNIDRMADHGVMFTNNCVTTSICWISRATLMTGVYASRHKHLHPWKNDNVFTTHAWNQTLFPLLKQHGYYTGIVGKWHANEREPYFSQAFDYFKLYYGEHWMERGTDAHGNPLRQHVTDLNAEDAVYFLQHRPKAQNFALKVSFFATHAVDGQYPSYEPKNATLARYYSGRNASDDIPRPKTATDAHWKRLPYFFDERCEGRIRWKRRFDPPEYQKNVRDLYALATEVDCAVGKVIEELKRQDVYNDTLLIFTTDNGNMHGEHGLAEKWFPFEESIRVPLVVQDPRMSEGVRGTVSNSWTLSVDLAPTMLGAAKIPPSNFMQGRDLAQLYLENNIKDDWRQDFFYEYNRGDVKTAEGHDGKFWIDASFALITHEWKYIYWPEHNYEQLFHRSIDPYDEWDTLLNRSTVQTNNEIYNTMKNRYDYLKEYAQSGHQI